MSEIKKFKQYRLAGFVSFFSGPGQDMINSVFPIFLSSLGLIKNRRRCDGLVGFGSAYLKFWPAGLTNAGTASGSILSLWPFFPPWPVPLYGVFTSGCGGVLSWRVLAMQSARV